MLSPKRTRDSDGIGLNDWTQPMTIPERAALRGHLKMVNIVVNFDEGLLHRGYPFNAAIKEGHLDVSRNPIHDKG